MKKLIALLLALILMIACTSCGSKKEDEVEDVSVLQDINVRKAIMFAIDRASLVKSLNDGSVAAEGIIPFKLASNPVTGVDFREEQGSIVGYDLAKAKEYYETACKELGKKKIIAETGVDYIFNIPFTNFHHHNVDVGRVNNAHIQYIVGILNRIIV